MKTVVQADLFGNLSSERWDVWVLADTRGML
jgi:hypothetical protein